jgi:hypothetical protein
MNLLKVAFAFVSVGGASYALFAAKEMPGWLKAIIVMLAATGVMLSLHELPRAVESVETAARRVASWFSSAPPTLGTFQVHRHRNHQSLNAALRLPSPIVGPGQPTPAIARSWLNAHNSAASLNSGTRVDTGPAAIVGSRL